MEYQILPFRSLRSADRAGLIRHVAAGHARIGFSHLRNQNRCNGIPDSNNAGAADLPR